MVDDAKTRSIISWLLVSVPLIMMGILLIANAPYLSSLFAQEAPWVVVGLLPCGWVVLLCIVVCVLVARVLLKTADSVFSFVWRWLLRATAVVLILIALTMVTVVPAILIIL